MALLVLPGHFPLRPACPRAADSVAAGLADHVAPRDRVLDIGCGTGQTTRDAARAAVAGSALGIDLSAQMLDHARRLSREEGLANVSFLQADAQVHPFPAASFEVGISRFGTMFFADPVTAFGNIGHALTRGGRLVLMVWQARDRNEWTTAIREALAGDDSVPAPPANGPHAFSLGRPGHRRGHTDGGRLRRDQLHRRARAGLLGTGSCRRLRRGPRSARHQGPARGTGPRRGRPGAGPVARHTGRAPGRRRRVLRRAHLDHRRPARLRIPRVCRVPFACCLIPARENLRRRDSKCTYLFAR